jgi:hypothetical protein
VEGIALDVAGGTGPVAAAGRQVKDRAHPFQGAFQGLHMAHRFPDQLSPGMQMGRTASVVSRRFEIVQHSHGLASFDEPIYQVRTDEARTSRDQKRTHGC